MKKLILFGLIHLFFIGFAIAQNPAENKSKEIVPEKKDSISKEAKKEAFDKLE